MTMRKSALVTAMVVGMLNDATYSAQGKTNTFVIDEMYEPMPKDILTVSPKRTHKTMNQRKRRKLLRQVPQLSRSKKYR